MSYPVYDHDKDGHAGPDIEPGRVHYDEDSGKVVCSIHGDRCALDGSLVRGVTEAPVVEMEDGTFVRDQDNAKPVGDARLYKCTVCGQGTWSHQG